MPGLSPQPSTNGTKARPANNDAADPRIGKLERASLKVSNVAVFSSTA